MLITYKTNIHSPDHLGFTAQYEVSHLSEHFITPLTSGVTQAVCGGDLDMEAGQLESPNFPEDYQPNKECIWRVRNCLGISGVRYQQILF